MAPAQRKPGSGGAKGGGKAGQQQGSGGSSKSQQQKQGTGKPYLVCPKCGPASWVYKSLVDSGNATYCRKCARPWKVAASTLPNSRGPQGSGKGAGERDDGDKLSKLYKHLQGCDDFDMAKLPKDLRPPAMVEKEQDEHNKIRGVQEQQTSQSGLGQRCSWARVLVHVSWRES